MRMLALFSILLFTSSRAYAACVPVGASDGMMATVICYPDPQPAQPFIQFNTPSFDYGAAGLNLSPPTSRSSSGMTLHTGTFHSNQSPGSLIFDHFQTFTSMPTIPLPTVPNVTTGPSLQLPTFTTPPGPPIGAQAQAAAAAAGAAAAIFYYSQQAAFKAANSELDESQKALDERVKTNRDQLDVQFNSEFAAMDEDIEDSMEVNNADLKSSIESDGLLSPDLVTDPSMRVLSEKLALKSNINAKEGRLIRQLLNRALAFAHPHASAQQVDTLKTAAVMAVAADLALSEGRNDDAARLTRAAGITLDIAIGFVPIASSVNDATQIVFG